MSIEIFKSKEDVLKKYPLIPKNEWAYNMCDITGQTFGKLTAICPVRKKPKQIHWVCKCECGNYTAVRSLNLFSGNSTSCGCVTKEKSKQTILIASRAAWEITTEKLESGEVVGPAGVVYFGPSNEKDYRNQRKDYFICPLCGKKFLSIRANIKNGHTRSCGCSHSQKSSLGEMYISDLLKKENIAFERESNPSGVAKISRCRYDFYLPNKNILIEFHGQQHYEYIKHFYKTESEFKHRQELDRLKISAALAAKIPLYCIPYWEIDNIHTFTDITVEKFLAKTQFHNDIVWRDHQKSIKTP